MAIFFDRLLARASRPKIFGDGSRRRATTSTSATSCARRWRPAEHDGGVFNVGTGRETSVVELFELCQRTRGHEHRGGVRAGPARGAAAERARPGARGRRARLAAGAESRRRPPRDLGVLQGLAGTGRVEANHGPARGDLGPSPPPASLAHRDDRRRRRRRVRLLLLLIVVRRRCSRTRRRANAKSGAPRSDAASAAPSRSARPSPHADHVLVLNGNGIAGAAAAAAVAPPRAVPGHGTGNTAQSYGRERRHVPPGPPPGSKAARRRRSASTLVGPLDGIVPRQLHGAQVVVVLGT